MIITGHANMRPKVYINNNQLDNVLTWESVMEGNSALTTILVEGEDFLDIEQPFKLKLICAILVDNKPVTFNLESSVIINKRLLDSYFELTEYTIQSIKKI